MHRYKLLLPSLAVILVLALTISLHTSLVETKYVPVRLTCRAGISIIDGDRTSKVLLCRALVVVAISVVDSLPEL